jgi:hypothetical protein
MLRWFDKKAESPVECWFSEQITQNGISSLLACVKVDACYQTVAEAARLKN